jgi:hypothetical protein
VCTLALCGDVDVADTRVRRIAIYGVPIARESLLASVRDGEMAPSAAVAPVTRAVTGVSTIAATIVAAASTTATTTTATTAFDAAEWTRNAHAVGSKMSDTHMTPAVRTTLPDDTPPQTKQRSRDDGDDDDDDDDANDAAGDDDASDGRVDESASRSEDIALELRLLASLHVCLVASRCAHKLGCFLCVWLIAYRPVAVASHSQMTALMRCSRHHSLQMASRQRRVLLMRKLAGMLIERRASSTRCSRQPSVTSRR